MIAHNGREQNLIFSGRSDYTNTRGFLADLLLDSILRRISVLPPQTRRILDLNPAPVDPEIYRPLSFSRDPQAIVASRAQLGAPESADIGFGL